MSNLHYILNFDPSNENVVHYTDINNNTTQFYFKRKRFPFVLFNFLTNLLQESTSREIKIQSNYQSINESTTIKFYTSLLYTLSRIHHPETVSNLFKENKTLYTSHIQSNLIEFLDWSQETEELSYNLKNMLWSCDRDDKMQSLHFIAYNSKWELKIEVDSIIIKTEYLGQWYLIEVIRN